MTTVGERKMYKDPSLHGVIVAGLSGALGCFARWYWSHRFGKGFSLLMFLMDMTISAGVGYLIYWLVIDFEGHQSLAAMAAAISGNAGSRVFDVVQSELSKRAGIDLPEQKQD